jgi:hypothetical protein
MVKDERTHPCSGAEIARSDHNMILIDLHLAPSDHLPAPHAGPLSAQDTYEYTPRDTYWAHVLADNCHDHHSKRLARDARKSPQALPQELYQEALSTPLAKLHEDILQALGDADLQASVNGATSVRRPQEELDGLYDSLVSTMSEALANTVGKFPPPLPSGNQEEGAHT